MPLSVLSACKTASAYSMHRFERRSQSANALISTCDRPDARHAL
ncbi:protein of unknown function [Microbacterium sp. Nx66]|nr:protein of unknown function [Microbacterium sp. Nx66]